ncbi:hypothetical protein ABPG72_001474 [Tetrahymena utriculariae]
MILYIKLYFLFHLVQCVEVIQMQTRITQHSYLDQRIELSQEYNFGEEVQYQVKISLLEGFYQNYELLVYASDNVIESEFEMTTSLFFPQKQIICQQKDKTVFPTFAQDISEYFNCLTQGGINLIQLYKDKQEEEYIITIAEEDHPCFNYVKFYYEFQLLSVECLEQVELILVYTEFYNQFGLKKIDKSFMLEPFFEYNFENFGLSAFFVMDSCLMKFYQYENIELQQKNIYEIQPANSIRTSIQCNQTTLIIDGFHFDQQFIKKIYIQNSQNEGFYQIGNTEKPELYYFNRCFQFFSDNFEIYKLNIELGQTLEVQSKTPQELVKEFLVEKLNFESKKQKCLLLYNNENVVFFIFPKSPGDIFINYIDQIDRYFNVSFDQQAFKYFIPIRRGIQRVIIVQEKQKYVFKKIKVCLQAESDNDDLFLQLQKQNNRLQIDTRNKCFFDPNNIDNYSFSLYVNNNENYSNSRIMFQAYYSSNKTDDEFQIFSNQIQETKFIQFIKIKLLGYKDYQEPVLAFLKLEMCKGYLQFEDKDNSLIIVGNIQQNCQTLLQSSLLYDKTLKQKFYIFLHQANKYLIDQRDISEQNLKNECDGIKKNNSQALKIQLLSFQQHFIYLVFLGQKKVFYDILNICPKLKFEVNSYDSSSAIFTLQVNDPIVDYYVNNHYVYNRFQSFMIHNSKKEFLDLSQRSNQSQLFKQNFQITFTPITIQQITYFKVEKVFDSKQVFKLNITPYLRYKVIFLNNNQSHPPKMTYWFDNFSIQKSGVIPISQDFQEKQYISLENSVILTENQNYYCYLKPKNDFQHEFFIQLNFFYEFIEAQENKKNILTKQRMFIFFDQNQSQNLLVDINIMNQDLFIIPCFQSLNNLDYTFTKKAVFKLFKDAYITQHFEENIKIEKRCLWVEQRQTDYEKREKEIYFYYREGTIFISKNSSVFTYKQELIISFRLFINYQYKIFDFYDNQQQIEINIGNAQFFEVDVYKNIIYTNIFLVKTSIHSVVRQSKSLNIQSQNQIFIQNLQGSYIIIDILDEQDPTFKQIKELSNKDILICNQNLSLSITKINNQKSNLNQGYVLLFQNSTNIKMQVQYIEKEIFEYLNSNVKMIQSDQDQQTNYQINQKSVYELNLQVFNYSISNYSISNLDHLFQHEQKSEALIDISDEFYQFYKFSYYKRSMTNFNIPEIQFN